MQAALASLNEVKIMGRWRRDPVRGRMGRRDPLRGRIADVEGDEERVLAKSTRNCVEGEVLPRHHKRCQGKTADRGGPHLGQHQQFGRLDIPQDSLGQRQKRLQATPLLGRVHQHTVRGDVLREKGEEQPQLHVLAVVAVEVAYIICRILHWRPASIDSGFRV